MSVTAVIAAAGSGERLGAGGPKAFVPLAGRPMVEWSIAAMRAAAGVRSIVVAVPPVSEDSPSRPANSQQVGPPGDWAIERGAAGSITLVAGGATRAESVSNALQAVETELVAIHDAARPLVTPQLVEGVVATLLADPDADGAIAAAPVTDTIKRVAEVRLKDFQTQGSENPSALIVGTVDRGRLWAAQTPQVFRVEALRQALAADPAQVEAATDEAMLVEAAGGRVLIHPSPPENFKVTTQLDLRLSTLVLAEQ
jgi:2-C-methyl-D-erythritol 4-phosphate cytidylyltransferase